jgi:hypothetical protein
MMLQEYTEDYMSMQEHTMVSDSSQRHVEVYNGIHRDTLDGREETYLIEHGYSSLLQQCIDLGDHLHSINSCMSDDGWRVVDQQFEELPLIVPGSLDDYSPWVPLDEIFVQSWGLTKSYDTFQSYSRLYMFLLSFPDTFVMDNNIGGDKQWQWTRRVVRSGSPDSSACIAYNMIGVDHQRQIVETLGVMVSIVGHGIADISEGDIDSDEDEHGGIPTVTRMTHEKLVAIGSDEIPSFPWDPRAHLVSRLFHLMMAQVAPYSNILHSWMVSRGLAGACPMR